jgi:putative endopeptidase
VIDGFTGDQRFFLGWGQIWRRKYRDDELRRGWSSIRTARRVPLQWHRHEHGRVPRGVWPPPGDVLYRRAPDRVRIW